MGLRVGSPALRRQHLVAWLSKEELGERHGYQLMEVVLSVYSLVTFDWLPESAL
jgi:hypothetical protein